MSRFDALFFVIILILFVVSIFFVWFFSHQARVKERMMLIEKGIDLYSLPKSGKFRIRFPWFKIGIVLTSIATGLMLGVFLMAIPFFASVAAGNLPLPLMFLFGGIGMILAHFLDKPKAEE